MDKYNNISNHKLVLKSLSPIFIGGGDNQKLSKLDYVIDQKQQLLYVFDESKLLQFVFKNDLMNQYNDFILKKTAKQGLVEFFIRNNISKEVYKDISRYTLKLPKGLESANDICGFMKNIYHKPYIPGSSLKGAIRTSLLISYILENRNSNEIRNCWEQIKYEEPRKIKQLATNLENKIFNIDPRKMQTSLMKGIRISDSKEFSLDDLELIKKKDFNIEKNSTNEISLFREYLKPNKEIEFSITIDHDVLNRVGFKHLSKSQGLINALDRTLEFQLEHVYSKFKFKPNGFKETFDFKEMPNIILGGGSGFFSKVLLYAIAPSIDDATAIIKKLLPRNKNHYKDKIISPRMLKLAEFQNINYIVGMGKIRMDNIC